MPEFSTTTHELKIYKAPKPRIAEARYDPVFESSPRSTLNLGKREHSDMDGMCTGWFSEGSFCSRGSGKTPEELFEFVSSFKTDDSFEMYGLMDSVRRVSTTLRHMIPEFTEV
jgi:hypothetical protein